MISLSTYLLGRGSRASSSLCLHARRFPRLGRGTIAPMGSAGVKIRAQAAREETSRVDRNVGRDFQEASMLIPLPSRGTQVADCITDSILENVALTL